MHKSDAFSLHGGPRLLKAWRRRLPASVFYSREAAASFLELTLAGFYLEHQ